MTFAGWRNFRATLVRETGVSAGIICLSQHPQQEHKGYHEEPVLYRHRCKPGGWDGPVCRDRL